MPLLELPEWCITSRCWNSTKKRREDRPSALPHSPEIRVAFRVASCCIFACFHPFYFVLEQKKKKPITRAVISFFCIYRSLKMSRSSRNRTHIDGFGDHCSTFELCSYHGPDRTDELYYSKLSRQKQVFFAKRSAGGCHSARSAHLLRRPCENVPAGSGCETAFCRIRSEKEEEM